jgi:probable HAF family extracellular repeat protein
MKRVFHRFICVLTLLAAFAMPFRSAAEQHKSQHIRYAVEDLGVLSGLDPSSTGYDINNAGWVSGGSGNLFPPGPQHAFLWFGKSGLVDLGTLGGPNSEAGGPNLRGEAAIISETAETDPNGEDFCGFGDHLQCLAAIWRLGKLIPLPTLPGGNNAQAYGLNNFGQIIGFSETGVEDPTCATSVPFQVLRYEAVTWEPNGVIRKLRPLRGDTVSFAFGINDQGQAVGASGLCSNTPLPPNNQPNAPHAVLWEKDGSVVNLGSIDGASANIATSINDAGEVVGNSHLPDGTVHPFVWGRNSGIRDLGAFPGALLTVAPCCNTINNLGEVAGFWLDANFNQHPFLWQDNAYRDLNDLVAPGSPWLLQSAEAINDAGEITGQGLINGEEHAFLAIPCDRKHAHSEACKQ